MKHSTGFSFFSSMHLIYFLLLISQSCIDDLNKKNSISITKTQSTLQEIINLDNQLIIAEALDSSDIRGKLCGLKKLNGQWTISFDTVTCVFGKRGIASKNNKFEGDLKTPSGYFSIGPAFGYEVNISSYIEYIQLTDKHYWVNDVKSAEYNKLVSNLVEGISAEKMKRTDNLYKYGLVIQYNSAPIIRGNGSAIFIHVWRNNNAPTAGCIALEESDLKRLIEWITTKDPHIVIGSRDNPEFTEIIKREMQPSN